MPEQPSEALANALNDIERLRKRSLLVTRLLIYPSILFLTAAIVTLLFSPNKWLGLTWGIISLYGLIAAVGVDGGKTAYANTQLILKAIESLPWNEAPRGR
jgi:hypothetical protein